MKKEIDNLLARYFGGNTSEQDMQALEQWISLSVENQQYFDQLTQLYAQLGDTESSMPQPNTEHAKKSFQDYMAMQKSIPQKQILDIRHKPFYKRWMFQAASIVIILSLSISIWLIYTSEYTVVLATQWTLKQDTLPDQTKIKLSRNSKIIYSSNYGKKSRKINLVGKAFFDVGHKGKGVLQISADETFIEDIGTVFSISAYPDKEDVTVNVREGMVHFYTTDNSGLNLKANETGIYNKQTKIFTVLKSRTDTIAVNLKHVQFNGIALSEAIKILSKQYGVEIKLSEPSIGKREITVNFEGENVDLVLRVIAETLDLNVTKLTDGYLLSRNTNIPER